MKLHEALSSGKPFRAKGSEGDWLPAGDSSLGWTFTTTEILDYEWEVKPEAREWDMWIGGVVETITEIDMSTFAWKKIRVREIL